MLVKLVLSAAATLLVYGLYKLVVVVLGQLNSPLRDLPGPKSPSWIYGNFAEIIAATSPKPHEDWVQQYGSTISYKGFLNIRRFYTTDLKALNYMLTHTDEFGKPEPVRFGLARLLGPGVLIVEGEQHKQQRKIMNPAFGPAQIRELTPIFTEKANQLRDIWRAEIAKQEERTPIDILPWLSRLTLDVIGLAGFHHKFDALNQKENELSKAFSVVFATADQIRLLAFLQAIIPPLRMIVTKRDRIVDLAKAKMHQIGEQLLRESKAAIGAGVNDEAAGSIEKDDLRGRDLLSLLVRANVATDIPESQRLSDDDAVAQVPTFLVAGHETTSNAVLWALYALADQPDLQSKLREELFSHKGVDIDSENPTMDQLNSLPYLDSVVRETLRLHSPVASTIRQAKNDSSIPLGTPIVDKNGKVLHSIRLTKGDPIFIPIMAINQSKALWGEDAGKFRPERWEATPDAVNGVPGVWGNLMTFLGGPRACIGYRFSIVETKAILFSLVKAFKFELAVPAEKITKRSSMVQRPVIIGEEGNRMPMFITQYQRS